MKKLLAISFLLVLGLSAFPVTYVKSTTPGFQDQGIIPSLEDRPSPGTLTPGGTVGLFCEVEKVDVCVMAQTGEDCTKLGGKKVDSCSMAEKTEDKK